MPFQSVTLWYLGGSSRDDVIATATARITPTMAMRATNGNLPPNIMVAPKVDRMTTCHKQHVQTI
jgi:hypothetical protein